MNTSHQLKTSHYLPRQKSSQKQLRAAWTWFTMKCDPGGSDWLNCTALANPAYPLLFTDNLSKFLLEPKHMPSYQILQILQTKQAGFIPTRDLSHLKVTKMYFLLSLWWRKKKIIPRKFIAFWLLEIMFGCQDEKTWETEIKRKRNDNSILCSTYTFVCGAISPVLSSSAQEGLEILEASDEQPGWLKNWTIWCAETLKKSPVCSLEEEKAKGGT